jgi:hypothetical protein
LDRLHLIAPDLVSVLAAASPAQRQRVAVEVARWVTSRVERVPTEVAASLSGTPSPQLHQIVEQPDDEYLSLQAKEDVGECTDDEVWAAAGSVDTGLSFFGFLECYRTDVAEC